MVPKKDKLKSIAYCGLCCPECYKMKVAKAAEVLKKELELAKTKGAKFLRDLPILEKDLDNLIKLRCQKFCRQGGGNSNCQIKRCCKERNIIGCWECLSFKKCLKLKPQFVENLKKIKKSGPTVFRGKIN